MAAKRNGNCFFLSILDGEKADRSPAAALKDWHGHRFTYKFRLKQRQESLNLLTKAEPFSFQNNDCGMPPQMANCTSINLVRRPPTKMRRARTHTHTHRLFSFTNYFVKSIWIWIIPLHRHPKMASKLAKHACECVTCTRKSLYTCTS